MEVSTLASIPPSPKTTTSTRQPLQSLPATPLNKRPALIHISTSPLPAPKPYFSMSIDPSENSAPPSRSAIITPPQTPNARKKIPSLPSTLGSESSGTEESEETVSTENKGVESETDNQPPKASHSWSATSPKPYLSNYKLLGSISSGYEEFGRGVWSAVYRAVESSPSSISLSDLPTPPTSPSNLCALTSAQDFLAVKAPIRRDAHKVLDNEARILTYLHQTSQAADFLVTFHGYDAVQHSIVLDAHPLNLASYAKSALLTAHTSLSTGTMFDPIIGAVQWASLAKGLISGLDFLHSQKCVHGDIKPANILLTSTLKPLYCDFSSSHIICPGEQPGEISANTPDFSSPELLTSFYRRGGESAIATPASDVFALGVTLLVAATGESPYVGARMGIQKLSMAKEGRPMEFARTGGQASRLMKGKVVEECLARSLDRDPEKRIGADAWKLYSMALLKE